MFGVLEHVGVWGNDGEKYDEPNEGIWEHRRAVLSEANRTLSPSGTLLLTKFPNRYGRDKLQPGEGHLNSERTRPTKLINEVERYFHVKEFWCNGLLPHRIPFEAPFDSLPRAYTHLDHKLSNFPVISQIAQNYCLIADPV